MDNLEMTKTIGSLDAIMAEDFGKSDIEMRCMWKRTRDMNNNGEGTTFTERDYIKCDDCTGHDYSMGCYVKYIK